MYKVLVKWFDLTKFEKVMSETELRLFISSNKRTVRYAEVVTPSGVTKEITNFLNKQYMEGVIWKDKSVSWKDDEGKVYTTGSFKTKKEAKEFLTKLGTVPLAQINIKGLRF